MDRYLCIHCHFYQPPRENPWLEAIEIQDSATPFHDWNERITAECYAPNSAARILDSAGRIQQIVNNYAHISFNFGPTLLSWMEDRSPDIYQSILDADTESQQRCSGHGNAIAQCYNHMILPLANRRDKYTQAYWGMRDFEHRFNRQPEGMWLPETAADIESLEVLADLGIKYTILAPHQAGQERRIGTSRWKNVEGAQIDPTRPYACKLPSGRTITLFFYDGPISRAVAFEGLLSNGEHFAKRLLSGFSDNRKWPQLMHIATDGETYGHHHRHGDMALAYALHHISSNNLAKLTNYGEYLEKHPPTHEAEIINNTSWSCAHGVERWRSNCGCNSGMKAGWSQEWRGPLRAALDSLREDLTKPYEDNAREILNDPWKARDDYVNVVLDRSERNINSFFETHAVRTLTSDEKVRALKLLEMQRHAMLMYTSCGWFFDELSGIETVQVIMYAGRALQLAQDLFANGYEQHFLDLLRNAHSNVPEFGTGADIYNRWVKPAQIDLIKVGAHYAISSIFDRYAEESSIYSYSVRVLDDVRLQSGRAQLNLGQAQICSRITLDCAHVSFGTLHFGDHNVNAGVRDFRSEEEYKSLVDEASAAFNAADLPAAIRTLDRHFEGVTYSVKSLFRDEQRRVLQRILGSMTSEAESSLRQIYEHHAPLMGFLADIGSPLPPVLRMTSEFVLNSLLRRAFSEDDLQLERVETLLQTARRENVPLDIPSLSYTLKKRLDDMAGELLVVPRGQTLERFNAAISLVQSLPFEVDLWRLQNAYYFLLQNTYPEMSRHDDEAAHTWTREFEQLGELLKFHVQTAQERPVHEAA
jgi:alpha-amylase/alpha-mannosidase (GH57 family)